MSTGDDTPTGPADPTTADAVALAQRALERQNALETRIEQLEAKLDDKTTTITELREEINALEKRTDLLHLVEETDNLDARQRSVALLQHLKQAAEREATRGRDPRHSLTRDQAAEALHHPDVERTTIYTDMRRAAELVDDTDVVWYGDGPSGNARLFIDLSGVESTALTEVL